MKCKRRRSLEVPPKVRSFIDRVTSCALENIEEPLRGFVWEFDKGNFHHWVDLFNHFDLFFEKFIKPRKDLQVEGSLAECDPPFPREAVLHVLRVTRIILENCRKKHLYSSYEQHLSLLLASTDADVVESSLKTLCAFLKKAVGRGCIRDVPLSSKLFAFSQGWGSREEGLGLVACSLKDGCDLVASSCGSTLHFEFYAVGEASSTNTDGGLNVNHGLQVIDVPNLDLIKETDLELFHKLVKEFNIPDRLCFSLLTRLRFARSFGSIASRHQYIRIRLLAFVVLVQASNDTDDLITFFNNEPEFVDELVSLLRYEDEVPEEIRILAILSLASLCQDRTHQPKVLTSVTSGSSRGILPSLMQTAVDAVVSTSEKCSIIFADALLSLVHDLVNSSPGSLALREAGFIPTILPLLKDTKPQHLHLVTTAVHIVEGFIDYNNHPAALFRDLGGLDDTIARLKVEVSIAEKSQKGSTESHSRSKGKQVLGATSDTDVQSRSDALISYHRKLLLKALLRAISLASYAPGSSARIGGSEESILPHCLSIVFRRAKDFGGGVFSLAAIAMSDLIHKDPTCFPVLDAAGLPKAFLDAILGTVLSSGEAVKCIPQCLDALCLNNTGLQQVRERNALRCFVKIFTSRSYLRALNGDTLQILSSGLDELMRHASTLRASGVDMLIEILNTILKIGSGSDSCPADSSSSSTAVPMETDREESRSDASKMACSEQIIEECSDVVSVETFLPECVSNAARLLETILQNADTCRVFIEKKGIEVILKLFTLPLMPISASIGLILSPAFKNISSAHSAALARSVCFSIREHIKLTNEQLTSICGAKLAEIDCAKQTEIMKYLTSLEGLLSLSNFLLKGTSNMVSELGSSDADILIDLGKAYKEILWQISLSSDHKKDEKRDTDETAGAGDALIPSVSGRESYGDGNIVPEVRYMNPVSLRRPSASNWSVERDFVSVLRSSGSLHRHGRHGLSRLHGNRISRQADVSYTDSEGSFSTLENIFNQEVKKKSPEVIVSELLSKLALAIRSFLATLVKGLTARRRNETATLSPTSKSVVTAIAKFFYDALNYSGYPTSGLEMSLSVKCRYLGKVVDDMSALTVDKRRVCHTVLVNSFYGNGTFKELLTTFEATSQLLWTLPFSLPPTGPGQEISHNLWLLDTLQSYCRLLEHLANASLLLSAASSSQAQLLVHPVASGLSIGLFSIPRDPEEFVRMLQSQVLDVILPIWNHPNFPTCSVTFITSVISIVSHIYSDVGDLKQDQGGITRSTNQRIPGPPLDESTIATIVEMGFSRARAEEALRSVRTNSVELATDWLFSHPEEVHEDDQLAQALALSLGTSSETSREDNSDETKTAVMEERGTEAPPIDDILTASVKLFGSQDSISFPLTDLLVTLCNRSKGKDRPRVVSFLIQQLKLCPSDFSKDIGALCPVAHVLALILSQDGSTREIAAENGVVSAALDILVNLRVRYESITEALVTKSVSALLLLLDDMLQLKPKFHTEDVERSSKSLSDPVEVDVSLALSSPATDKKPAADGVQKVSDNVFERILGNSTGYLTLQESQKALDIACELIKRHVPAMVMQAVLQLTARLTKTHAIATQFLESGGLSALVSLPKICMFPGFDSFASSIIRHVLEDPQTLQSAMESEIRQTLLGTLSRHVGRLSPRLFLTSVASLISRDPAVFMLAAAAVCQIDSSGGRLNVVLLKEKEKDREKVKGSVVESGIQSNDIRMPENKPNDAPGKCFRSHKRVPASLTQVIDQLLEIVMSYPSRENPEAFTSSLTPMEIDESLSKEKGKSKIDEKRMDLDSFSDTSALMARLIFILKLMSEILLIYAHAVGVVLKRDSEMSQLRGSGQVGSLEQGGILHHVLHHLLPLSSVKIAGNSDDLGDKLSGKASWFLVVLCGRSTEGRRRVIFELVKALASLSNSENSSKSILVPSKKVLSLVDLVNSILSKNSSSSNLPGPGCSPDIAQTMIDAGIVQSLSGILQVIDLDHPDAPKVANLILKALESLTRAANASDHSIKSNGPSKSSTQERTEDYQTNMGTESERHDSSAYIQQGDNRGVQTEGHQVEQSPHDDRDQDTNPSQFMEQDMLVDREDNIATNLSPEESVELMHEEDVGGLLQSTNEADLAFRVEHRTNNTSQDDDEDIGEDDDEDDDDNDEEEDIAEEGAALMSLADTDLEDHEENAMGDEYNEDMIDEDEDDFSDNHVIEVRLREGLAGLDRLGVLRSGDTSSFADIAAEPFQVVNTDEILHLHRPWGLDRLDRHRQNANRNSLDRSGPDGSVVPHPLLQRPSPSQELITSTAGNSSREVEGLTYANFDVSQFYTFGAALPSDHDGMSITGDRMVGGAPSSFFDFSLGLETPHGLEVLPHIAGLRSVGDSRWTDTGQPQAGSHAAAIAEALEEHFVSQLRALSPVTELSAQRQSEQVNQQPIANSQIPAAVDNLSAEPTGSEDLEHVPTSVHPLANIATGGGDSSLPDPSLATNGHSVGAWESQLAPEIFPEDLHMPHSGNVNMLTMEEQGPTNAPLDTIPELDASADLQDADHQMQDSSEIPAQPDRTEFDNTDGPSDTDINSSCHAVVNVGSTVPNSSDAIPQETSQTDHSHSNTEVSNSNAIDPTFLEALPEDLRAEVLASQQAQPAQPAIYAPPLAEEIDPEFLAALPPDIQAEVLAQQRAQRVVHSQQAVGQPVDMDNASIIATFPPDLREEVLLTSSEAVLSALPSALLAEAQILRDRATSHYHARSSIFGGSQRLGTRRLALERHLDRHMNRAGQRAVSAISSSLNVKEIDGLPLLDVNALKALVRLLRLAQPLGKGLLQRLLLNLCANTVTRAILVGLLVDMIRPEGDLSYGLTVVASHRLYGCQWNVVYGRPQSSNGLPPLVSRRVLEILTYLATNHSSVATILFYFDRSLSSQYPTVTNSENSREKGKEKVFEAKAPEASQEADIPFVLFLKLLNKPLFLRSSAHLEQVMGLLQVVVHNAIANIDCQRLSGLAAGSSETQSASEPLSDTQKDISTSEQNTVQDTTQVPNTEVPSSDGKKSVRPYDILLRLPAFDLRNLCNVLAHEGLSDKVYSLAADILKKLASVALPLGKFFAVELAGLAHTLSGSAVGELVTLRSTDMLGLSSGSMAGAAILRVLGALSGLSLNVNKGEEVGAEIEDQSVFLNLNVVLEPLWQELSDCITTTEMKLGHTSNFASSVRVPDSGDIVGGTTSQSPPLPPGTQRLLPFIEAFFVLCEKLQTSQTILLTDSNVTAREVKECSGSSPSPSLKISGTGNITFARIAEKHRRLLNVFIRQNPSLLEKSLSLMLKVPRLIDFDNKRAYFRSRIRQQHDQHPSAPLRVSVRRAYVLEDSYNQLRLRPTQDLKGRLTVQFQGEEGIDAGGLTREWYQLLSRVIFDKGALLFTTVGNDATFQPNPNSVYQTEHLSYFRFVGRVVAKALFDGQLLDVYFTRSFYKHILGVKVTYHDIEAVDPDYYKNLKWMLENDVSDIPDLTFSMDADEEKHILYEKTEVTDYELIPGGRNIRVTEETKQEYVDLVAEHILTTAIRPQINSFLEGFTELVPRELISIFNDKELELLISGLPEIDFDDLKAHTEYTGFTSASPIIHWFWDVVRAFSKEDMARFLQFVTGTSKVPLEGFKALQGISGPQRFQIHKAYGAPERLPSAHTCFNQLDLPEYSSKEQLEERMLLAIHEASEGFGFG